MGAYNELIVQDESGEEIAIQFKCGVRFQYKYRVGEKIEFLGEPPKGEKEISGIGGDDLHPSWRYFAIRLQDDVIRSYREIDETEFDRLHSLE